MSTFKLRPPTKVRLPGNASGHCHFLVKQTAVEMAHSVYEEVMRDNKAYKMWKEQCPDLTPEILEERFVALLWPKLLGQARATLARLLTTKIADSLKEQIHDALIKDNELIRGRTQQQPSTMIH